MNTKEYIESGMIESCVLGLASEEEFREFEALCIQYPEIMEARSTFEIALEDQLMKKSVTPPSHLRDKICQSFNTHDGGVVKSRGIKNPAPVHSMNVWKLVAAASVLLFAGAAYWAFYNNNRYQNLVNENKQRANEPHQIATSEALIAIRSIVQKPSVKWSTMVEPANSSHCLAHVYWDSVSQNTYLLIGNIPKSFSNKQFQLWALLDNQPIDLGIFDAKDEGQLIQMKKVNTVRAFYITVEPTGGSDKPNMQATYAIGEL